jgi:hypothetical protein
MVSLALGVSLALAQDDADRTQQGRPLQEHRASLLRAHRTLEYTTMGALALTAAGGVVAAINQPTLFGDGKCASGDPIFGDYGCTGFSMVHGTLGVLTTVSYVATMTVALSVPDRRGGHGEPGPFDYGGFHRAATWVHVVGFAALPLLGLTGAHPEMLGIADEDAENFSKTVRTVHASLGVVTAGAFTTTVLIERF